MVKRLKVCTRVVQCVIAAAMVGGQPAAAGDIYVAAGGNLQAAIDAAQPGDRIMLAPGATFVGNFRLPNKGSSELYITIRSAAADTLLPPAGVRVTPADAPNLARIRSGNTMSALSMAPGAHHWRLQWLEFAANYRGYGEIISLGAGDATQDTLAEVPHHLVLDRIYVHGDPFLGQKRGIAVNSGATWVLNSYISDIKAVGIDTQALMGFNGPGPWLVTNNYLEAAGENVLIGGASPHIYNLVPADLEFRRNHMTKPLSWRLPILGAPSGVTVTRGTGGSLPAGTYSYRIVAATRTAQDTWTFSARSVEVLATVGSSGRVNLSWSPVPRAIAYRVYRGIGAGAQDRYFDTTTASYVDSGSSAGVADNGNWARGTVWTVKNVFELKVGERVTVDGNVIENCWAQAQNGYAVLFTPRNQGGTSPGIYVRDVMFTNNLVRHAGGGFNISGYDDLHPSGQTQRITIRNNIVEDISAARYGGTGWFILAGNEPRDLVVDHNTVVHEGTILFASGGTLGAERQILGLVLTNNLFRHNTYGILGDSHGSGNDTLNAYFPDAVVLRNTFAGGNATRYPANNEFPTVSFWQSQFADFANSNYRLIATSPYVGTGTDGKDLGANVNAIQVKTQAALSGKESGGTTTVPVAIATTSVPGGTTQVQYATQLAATGGSGALVWSLSAGQLPPGLALSSAGAITGAPLSSGTFSFTVRAADAADATNAATRALQIAVIAAAATPQVTLTSPVSGSTVTGTTVALAANASDSDGTVMRVDYFAGSALVASANSSPWAANWTNVQPGTYKITARATDSQSLSAVSPAAAVTVASPNPESPSPSTARPAGEIVLYAADVTKIAGRWQKVSDPTAAAGLKLTSADSGWTSIAALASPTDYVEAAFDAPAGTAYHVWFRLRARGDSRTNDSVWVQFSDAVTVSGAPLYRLGTANALAVALEDCSGCPVSGWGWQDRGYWVSASYVQFAAGGTHAMRVQVREDGVELDQIVLTPAAANAPSPGRVSGDATILPKTALPSSDVVLHATDVAPAAIRGNWLLASSVGSPNRRSLRSKDLKWNTTMPLATPSHYFDVSFAAGAKTPYRVWVRLKAARNLVSNDSVWLQFSDTISGSAAVYRSGSSGGFGVALQTCSGCKLANWGWSGGAVGLSQPQTVTFAWSGIHRLRIQIREDGVEVDQVVLSPVRYLGRAPGLTRNDKTIVMKP